MILFSIKVTRLGGLGDGLGEREGLPVFIPKSCAGDVLEVRQVSSTKEAIRADIARIVTPGPDRIAAPCPHYERCGGCTLQHLTAEAYRQFKRDAVTQALGYGGFGETTPQFHFLPAATRRRADFKVQNGKLSYVALRSHERVEITQCLILTPRLQSLITPLGTLLTHAGAVQLTEADSGIDIQTEGHVDETRLRAFAEEHDIGRINGHVRKAITMRFGGYDVALPACAFLQASKEAETLMASLVADGAKHAKNIVEFFSGLGTYSFALAKDAKLRAYELDASMVHAMQSAGHANLSAFRRDLFKQPLAASELKGCDAAILNPPRAGADAQTKQLALSGIPLIIMVSCNPATWSRDAKTLKNAGYRLQSLHAIDQFVYSPHIELVSVFTKLHA